MKLPRRNFLHLAAGAAALPATVRIARAQTYPTRPVRLILGYAPGNAPDIVARLIGQWLSERLGQPFIIENRPGAGLQTAIRSCMSLQRTRAMRRSSKISSLISCGTLRRLQASSACLTWFR